MKLRRFLSVVPKAVRIAALILVGCETIGLLVAGYINRANLTDDLGAAFVAAVAAMFGGAFIATWLLCLGYVYGDARQRAMPPILWTLIALLAPNLLGFLLYFVLRRPLASACTNCGQGNSLNSRFCSFCGSPQSPATSGNASSGLSSSGLNSITAA